MKYMNMHTIDENVRKEIIIKKAESEKKPQPFGRRESPDIKERLEEIA